MMPIANMLKRIWSPGQALRGGIIAAAVILALSFFGPDAASSDDTASDSGTAASVVDAGADRDNSKAAVPKIRSHGKRGLKFYRDKRRGPKAKGPKKRGPFATLSGEVTNSLSGAGVANANISFATSSVTYTGVTNASGAYSERLPIATYAVTFAATDYESETAPASLVKGFAAQLDAALEPTAAVIVGAMGSGGDSSPGSMLNATGTWKIMDGSEFVAAEWSQVEGATAAIDAAPATPGDEGEVGAAVTLPPRAEYKAELIHLLQEPPIGADQLPPEVEEPPGEFVGGLQNRFQVVGINHYALERAGHVALQFAVTTTSGTYSAALDVHSVLDWRVNPGIKDVPIDRRVLLHGKDQPSWSWAFTTVPAGSAASLTDATTQDPEFTPDQRGLYVTTEDVSDETVEVYAGEWRGVIVGQDEEGRPVADESCTGCHDGGFAPDNFTPWAQSGHAEIFTNNLNTNSHYGENCFDCHTVGFDRRSINNGFDDASDFAAFLGSGLLSNPAPDNWSVMLDQYPESAQLANIQCENCHGPQSGTGAHMDKAGSPRVSISSDVCASCHGEPLRHARFQQWQLSRHSNYELAIDESQSGNCSRCHTGNGFLTWLPVLNGDVPGDPTASITVSWTEDEAHPQTCATCHDPHFPGSTSGINTNATVRITDNTPPLLAGFQAFGVGRGAICMTCHNSRRGLRNDDTWPATTDRDRAPHGSVQTDLLMGQNAYFVDVGTRGNHSYVEDSCVNCHMEQTPPPDVLSYNQGGTNHTFFASKTICSRCHGDGFTADGVQAGISAELDVLGELIEADYLTVIGDLIALDNVIDLDGEATITSVDEIQGIALSESRGRQALVFTLDSGTFGPTRLTTIDIVGPSGPATLFDFAGEDLLKASWNWILVHNDRSKGLHNPSYSTKVLEAAIGQF